MPSESSSSPKTPDGGVIHAEAAQERVVAFEDGRQFADVHLVVTKDASDRIWQGYQCAYCLEIFQEAWPETCRICAFPVKAEQRNYIRSRHVGDVKIGSRVSLADEFERMREMQEYEERTGLTLPDSVKFPNEIES